MLGVPKNHPSDYFLLENGNSLHDVLRAWTNATLDMLWSAIRKAKGPAPQKRTFRCKACKSLLFLPSSIPCSACLIALSCTLRIGKFALFCDSCLESMGLRIIAVMQLSVEDFENKIQVNSASPDRCHWHFPLLLPSCESPESLVRTFVLSLIYACLCWPTLFDGGTMVLEVSQQVIGVQEHLVWLWLKSCERSPYTFNLLQGKEARVVCYGLHQSARHS
ncbi:uncharacterized protein [Miscanthus floridulus]|uniref:uncharacterized protein isoform X2 n=1 Tax=Miscanthus floridulus TaxID=154761 RepID=UPI00345A6D78